MTRHEIRRIQAHFNRLYDKLARRLAQRMAAQAPVKPHASPPRPIRLVVLELARQKHGD